MISSFQMFMPQQDKIDDIKDRFCEELEHVSIW
jgi:hypothetical protein